MSKLTEKIKDMTDEELEILVWNAMRRRPYERISDNTHAMLDTAFAHIHSVPYQVSERWVFYRLWQEGVWWKTDTVDAKAKAADDFNSKLSRARHTQFRGWHPNILKSDEDYLSHEVVGNPTIASALEILPEILEASVYLPLDHFHAQKTYVEVWFEARAMAGQFQYYTKGVTLAGMGGMTKIPWKWDIAQRLIKAKERYGLPIVILYFGDADVHGRLIKTEVMVDVERWSDVEFEVEWCGLTKEQAEAYELPTNPDNPGYQWEALTDEQAREIIEPSIAEYVDLDIVEYCEKERLKAEKHWKPIIKKAVEDVIG